MHKILIQLTKLDNSSKNRCGNKPSSMEFHISREARQKYKFDDMIFQLNGNVIFANYQATRVFTQKINDKRDVINYPENAVRAGQINAMGLIDEILHLVVGIYREQKNTNLMNDSLKYLEKKLGKKEIDNTLLHFIQEFPPLFVYHNKLSEKEYLKSQTNKTQNRELVLEELVLLWLANVNPAFSPYHELFDDKKLEKNTRYKKIIDALHDFFNQQPFFGKENQNLIDFLRSPAIAEPHSLPGQLEYIRKNWGLLLGNLLYRLLRGLDLIKEEDKMRFVGTGPTFVVDFRTAEDEPERFSPDKEWMPHVVLIAKSIYVWLDQLSKKYQRHIHRLDQIPDEELDMLANWGITGLWLIGLWERSQASKNIKRMCGNPEAEASAYSLMGYYIASDLGGEEAFDNLSSRAWKRGIRMAGDMVPNHVGIDSNWVIEHPEWFISLDYCPYPSYSFNGPNLSSNNHIGIFLEDHYYNRSDAAVIFKRINFNNNETKYIYHGNDGTSTPWNDTAQLNYLNPEVREASIQTIIQVAKKFPIIRFDAAMTLSKNHFQRLWYPEPGTGGDIPTRSENGMTRYEFDAAMPKEFWREVVDRIAQEIPDTLLLAEAFWLTESYFVRTLGMHRVYNSAFMNMLKNEENFKYRLTIKNILEYNPEILRRYVNFMNNPDEDTAIAQFGKGDKYFGVCIMLVTMPGTPMIGHGQVEGFTEKYGMEYRRSYWDEQVDWDIVHRHEKDIFPLMRKRYLFAGVKNFYLYDFYRNDGSVDENVFAYSNSYGNEKALIIYNNKFKNTSGWIKSTVSYRGQSIKGNDLPLQQKSFGELMDLHFDETYFTVFRDHISGLEFIRSSKDIHENGMHFILNAYQYHVFLDFQEIQDNIWQHYAYLNEYLNGKGVPNLQAVMQETFLRPIHQYFKELVNPIVLEKIAQFKDKKIADVNFRNILETNLYHFFKEIKKFTNGSGDVDNTKQTIKKEFDQINHFPTFLNMLSKDLNVTAKKTIDMILKYLSKEDLFWQIIYFWLIVHRTGEVVDPNSVPILSRTYLDEWFLNKIIEDSLFQLGYNEDKVKQSNLLIKILTTHQNLYIDINIKSFSIVGIMEKLLKDSDVQAFLQMNRYLDKLWFNEEAFNQLLIFLLLIIILKIPEDKKKTTKSVLKEIEKIMEIFLVLKRAQNASEFQVHKLLDFLKKDVAMKLKK